MTVTSNFSTCSNHCFLLLHQQRGKKFFLNLIRSWNHTLKSISYNPQVLCLCTDAYMQSLWPKMPGFGNQRRERFNCEWFVAVPFALWGSCMVFLNLITTSWLTTLSQTSLEGGGVGLQHGRQAGRKMERKEHSKTFWNSGILYK